MITFYERAIGSSHVAAKKPCQDYGLAVTEDDVHIAIVCDGHGSESYVRSEIGSRIAAEITKEEIIQFIKSGATKLLIGKKGSVTAVPNRNPLKDNNGKLVPFDNLSESDQELVLQNKRYVKAVEQERIIENMFRNFFTGIVTAWKNAIKEHLDNNKFSPKEREKVGARNIEKAYGSTLMAAVWTSDCWFAFHLGDGKLLMANELMEWHEPVPWDCNCFLNYTTSLCDSNPVDEFRYAYNGTGEFPIAFMLGSDGLDDTFIKDELLHLFYSQVLKLIGTESKELVLQQLHDNLPRLSAKGSHDDMSVAAIINEDALSTAIQYFDILQKVRALNKERTNKENEIKAKENKINSLINEIKMLMQNHKSSAEHSLAHYIQMLEECQKEMERLGDENNSINNKVSILSTLMNELQQMKESFDAWKQQGKEKIGQLKSEAEEIKKSLSQDKESQPKQPQLIQSHDESNEEKNDEASQEKVVTPPPFNKNGEVEAETHEENQPPQSDIKSVEHNGINQKPVDEDEERRLDEESNAQFAELNKENNKFKR